MPAKLVYSHLSNIVRVGGADKPCTHPSPSAHLFRIVVWHLTSAGTAQLDFPC